MHRLKIAALSLITIAVVLISWLDVERGVDVLVTLKRLVRTLIALGAVSVTYGLVLPRLNWEIRWRDAIRQMTSVNAVLAVTTLMFILGIECSLALDGLQDFSPIEQSIAVAGAIVLIFVGLISVAVLPRLDPFSLSLEGRKGYVYAAQLVIGLLILHLFITIPDLFSEQLRMYWPYAILTVAFSGIAIGKALEKAGIEVAGSPFVTTGSLLPLVPVIGMWFSPNHADPTIVLLAVGVIYMINSVVFQSLINGLGAAIFGNLALWSFYTKFDGFGFLQHPQLWVIPPAISVIVAAQVYRKSIGDTNLVFIRYICAAIIFLGSTSEIFIFGLGEKIWPPMLLAVLSIAGVLCGIAMQVRAYMYLGTSFLLISVLTMVYHAGQKFNHVWPWWAFGIGVGILILAFFGLLEKKRPELEAMLKKVQTWER